MRKMDLKLYNTSRLALILGLFVLGIPGSTFAQSICQDNLELAVESYELGKLTYIENILGDCMESGLSKNDQKRALRLLTLTNIFLDNEPGAEFHLLSLLKLDPSYRPADNDPIELKHFFRMFNTKPLYFISINGGTNITNISELRRHTVYSALNSSQKYNPQASFHASVNADYAIRENWYVGAELMYMRNVFEQDEFFEFGSTNYRETQDWIKLPLYISYQYPLKKKEIVPFVYVGGSLDWLLRSSSSIRTVLQQSVSESSVISGADESLKDLREPINYSAIIGAGVNIPLGVNFVTVSARYSFGLTNIMDPSRRIQRQDIINRYGYVDDDVRLNSLMLTLSYRKSFYRPERTKIKGLKNKVKQSKRPHKFN